MTKYPDSSNQSHEQNSVICSSSVIPTKAGIQSYSTLTSSTGHCEHDRQTLSSPAVSPLAWPFIALIYLYRYSVGHWFTGYCRYFPSCSHYGEEALRKHGAFHGSIMTIKRLSRCNPWHEGGYDPVK